MKIFFLLKLTISLYLNVLGWLRMTEFGKLTEKKLTNEPLPSIQPSETSNKHCYFTISLFFILKFVLLNAKISKKKTIGKKCCDNK